MASEALRHASAARLSLSEPEFFAAAEASRAAMRRAALSPASGPDEPRPSIVAAGYGFGTGVPTAFDTAAENMPQAVRSLSSYSAAPDGA